jgi:hypothetical protein
VAFPTTVADTLAWEAAQRTRAAIVAIAAGVLLILGAVITGIALSDSPEVTVLDALNDAAGAPPSDGGLRTGIALFLHDHSLALTVGQVLWGLGGLLAALALTYLFIAIRARKPGMTQALLIALAVGGVAYFVGTITRQVARDISLSNFAGSGDHGTIAAHDAMAPPAYVVGSLFLYIGMLAMAIAFIIVCLNAMRVGLLTRFLGVLGMLAGLLFIVQVTALPVVQAVWLVALGATLLGWIRRPPAWDSGKAEPWPTRQEQLEARAASAGNG